MAVMFRDLGMLRRAAEVSPAAETLLLSPQAPIVLVPKRAAAGLAESVAPGNPWVGALLPSAPLHLRLLAAVDRPLIATSANLSGQPTCRSGIDVFGTMDGRIDLVLDGGLCTNTGATTVDITEPYWRVIKEGAVSEKEIGECLKGS